MAEDAAVPRRGQPTALIAGGGGDMGHAIARLLAPEWTVVVADRDPAAAGAVADDVGAGVIAVELDVADPGCIRAVAAECLARVGPVRGLVCAAGIEPPQRLVEVRPEDWSATQDVNVRGPALLAQSLVDHWRELGGGAVVNIGSRTWLGGPHTGYAASKAGLVGLTRSLAIELGAYGVTANVVAPSFVPTRFGRQRGPDFDPAAYAEQARRLSPLNRVVAPQDVAAVVAFLLSSGARAITGEVVHVCAGAQMTAF